MLTAVIVSKAFRGTWRRRSTRPNHSGRTRSKDIAIITRVPPSQPFG